MRSLVGLQQIIASEHSCVFIEVVAGIHRVRNSWGAGWRSLDNRSTLTYSVLMKMREFERKLRRLGVEIIDKRGRGSHRLLLYEGRETILPNHPGKDYDPVFLKMICKQLGIDPKEIF
jgi:predicted RNA binding protein YcfA (HicA-like mRNA interferase family)